MRQVIKDQLRACQFADLHHFDADTYTVHIPKYSKPKYDLNQMYLIGLNEVLINNTNSPLASNWNHGTAPSTKYLKIFVSKQLGKMIYVDSIGYDYAAYQDLNNVWSGWLPTEEIEQIAKL